MALEDWSILRISLFTIGVILLIAGLAVIFIPPVNNAMFNKLNTTKTRTLIRIIGLVLIFSSYVVPDKTKPQTTTAS